MIDGTFNDNYLKYFYYTIVTLINIGILLNLGYGDFTPIS